MRELIFGLILASAPMSDRCATWLAYLGDGNRAPVIHVQRLILDHMTRDCLGREPRPFVNSPPPPPPAGFKPGVLEIPT